jgi:23S rRNA (adenine-N6)-dimethyltransferase
MPGHSRRRPPGVTLSQHLLREPVADRIIASTGLAPPCLVFDLGAGEGALTAALAARGCRVVAVEIDRVLWSRLKTRFRDDRRVEPALADLLQFELPRHAPYAVVSNVPFGLTARLMRRLQDIPNPPTNAWLVLQEEAGRKWAGLGHETLASILLKVRFEVDVTLGLRRSDFVPRPSVDSVVVHLRRRRQPLFAGAEALRFRRFVERAFLGPDGSAARELTLGEWIRAFRPERGQRTSGRPTAPGARRPRAGGR